MLVSFLGSPHSGKTTTAAMVFSSLKEQGIPCEFGAEQARAFIAEKKLDLPPGNPFSLSDEDQLLIMQRQLRLDEALEKSSEGNLVVSDSSPLNSLLYMSLEFRQDPRVREATLKAVGMLGLGFLVPPVAPRPSESSDPNRLHTWEQSLQFYKQLTNDIQGSWGVSWEGIDLGISKRVRVLDGNPKERLEKALQVVFSSSVGIR